MKKLLRHNNGIIFYEAKFCGYSLFAFTIRDLVGQLYEIYSVDLRCFLFGGIITKN